MLQIDIGDKSPQCPQVTVLAVPTGSTVTVANLANSASSVSYFTNWYSGAAGTIAPNANQAFTNPNNNTGPVYLEVLSGKASIQVTGGAY